MNKTRRHHPPRLPSSTTCGQSKLGGTAVVVVEDERSVAAWRSLPAEWWDSPPGPERVVGLESKQPVAPRHRKPTAAWIKYQIGRRVRCARQRMRPYLRICDMARAAGVSEDWLSSVENGDGGHTRISSLRLVAVVLGVDVEWLLNGGKRT